MPGIEAWLRAAGTAGKPVNCSIRKSTNDYVYRGYGTNECRGTDLHIFAELGNTLIDIMGGIGIH